LARINWNYVDTPLSPTNMNKLLQIEDCDSNATAEKIIIRDINGRAKVANPSDSADIMTKGFADVNYGNTRIFYGSYVGTGTYGSDNKNSLTFGFVPKLLIIDDGDRCYTENGSAYALARQLLLVNGITSMNVGKFYDGGVWQIVNMNITWGATVSWYTSYTARFQNNQSGKTYKYVAIG
jgi:hypothetical protein